MRLILLYLLLLILAVACSEKKKSIHSDKDATRQMVDTVGFAHLDWQVDSVVSRIIRYFPEELSAAKAISGMPWRVAICPHDDYTYASWHYPALLGNLKAKTIILFGVAHKARQLNISDRIVFDNFRYWHGPYKKIKVSAFREDLIKALPKDLFLISDTLQKVEHSLESMLPFVQYFNRDAEIIPILVPFMDTGKMEEIARPLATAIYGIMQRNKLEWGKDIALLITTDAVHYGDEDWGGKNIAPFGADSAGYIVAIAKEHAVIDSCLRGNLNMDKIKKFKSITVLPDNYKEYRWTWCGRYSVPLGLMVAEDLRKVSGGQALEGRFIGYSTSIDHKLIKVDDLRMGKTANANLRHWVGYASIGYE